MKTGTGMDKIFQRMALVALLFLASSDLFAQNSASSAALANRRTALHCLSLAKDCAAAKNWEGAISQATLGLAYDGRISDLWYVLAIARHQTGSINAQVLPLVQTALTEGEWVDYNRDSARILYADILCDTGLFAQVPALLDAAPFLFSSDAEYIRAKAFYRMKTPLMLSRARNKIDSTRRIYPDDTRFPLLFFKNESPDDEDPEVRHLADLFIARISQYAAAAPDKDTELELYAALFARGETQVRMLKSFHARGLRHPRYAAAALRAGLLTQQQAFDYITAFSDYEIDYKVLVDFIPLITEEAVLKNAEVYFTSFAGTIVRDTDGDGLVNLRVRYSRGRPEHISYDKNQDGVPAWELSCDFGVPVSGVITERGLEVSWSPYPSLQGAVFRGENNQPLLSFTLVEESLLWTPVRIAPDPVFLGTGSHFFFPEVNPVDQEISDEMLVAACSSYEMPSRERYGATVRFMMLEGKVQVANYFVDGRMYAQTEFKQGFPDHRMVDADDDGIFETTEFYGFDYQNTMAVHTLEDERSVMTNLFGLPSEGSGFYVRLIQIDRDRDTVPDFTEEYLPQNGKITSWDVSGDGRWDIRFVRHPQPLASDGSRVPLVEEVQFYQTPQGSLVTVIMIDGIPVRVESESEVLSVQEDSVYHMFWIGRPGTSEQAAAVLEALGRQPGQGVRTVVGTGSARVLAIRVGNFTYGKLIFEEPERNETSEH